MIADVDLQNYYRPPFQAAVDSGVASAMNAYIEINGQPMASSSQYLTELLRDEMGFDGMLVTDWNEVRNQHSFHHVASSCIALGLPAPFR